ncbi:YcfL family protein [Vibrio sp. SCSIO 43135]|uniref:YcfL family protein n=1 Tax=Vibrio sp. SCSIO 43135 TaxID=2819096 RepID=UPI00207504DF|nr:YcfL family protein [Vibrio sp. SCSIO 43135]USD40250.1 YcfL family protein [Vibrio sp. SCSIO 43135]
MKKWLFAALIAVLVVGCSSNTAGLRVDGASQNVLFGDNVLGSRLVIDDIATTEVDGHARGVVRLVSEYNGDQHIQYRFYWYDEDGLEVNNKLSPWRQTVVRGKESFSISEVSVNPNGKQFRVQIREAD